MKIFREMDCACRNQQGNGDVAEIFCPNMFVIFIALWLLYAIIMIRHCFFFNALTFARSLGDCCKPWPWRGGGGGGGGLYKSLPRLSKC